MAELRRDRALAALAVSAIFEGVIATAGFAQEATPGLYDRPVLVLEPGMHTGSIFAADVDAAGRIAVTGLVSGPQPS
jgi:hypothetical protein